MSTVLSFLTKHFLLCSGPGPGIKKGAGERREGGAVNLDRKSSGWGGIEGGGGLRAQRAMGRQRKNEEPRGGGGRWGMGGGAWGAQMGREQ